MATLGRKIFFLAVGVLLSGCTLHFKGKDIELDAERQRVQHNETYELERAELLRG